ncbi:hypothetical protein DPEC_G00227440 [Dallia pectoralis]|uniref:Uncharacterized protein n=1 Tax=Dallia pectoralis TaxID=75939 RepID=A0ACC2G193_DALPE|nr:hypothetical protein DPEC_G00227440 [Dallia pectoralis]
MERKPTPESPYGSPNKPRPCVPHLRTPPPLQPLGIQNKHPPTDRVGCQFICARCNSSKSFLKCVASSHGADIMGRRGIVVPGPGARVPGCLPRRVGGIDFTAP